MRMDKVKSVSTLVTNTGVLAAADRTDAIADIVFQASTEAHSTWTCFEPAVFSQSTAEWLVISPTAVPSGKLGCSSSAWSINGLSGGNPSREGDTHPWGSARTAHSRSLTVTSTEYSPGGKKYATVRLNKARL